jgi:Spy/CpxP family protein refolding chaperone
MSETGLQEQADKIQKAMQQRAEERSRANSEEKQSVHRLMSIGTLEKKAADIEREAAEVQEAIASATIRKKKSEKGALVLPFAGGTPDPSSASEKVGR